MKGGVCGINNRYMHSLIMLASHLCVLGDVSTSSTGVCLVARCNGACMRAVRTLQCPPGIWL
jgi:hypothetical protein